MLLCSKQVGDANNNMEMGWLARMGKIISSAMGGMIRLNVLTTYSLIIL